MNPPSRLVLLFDIRIVFRIFIIFWDDYYLIILSAEIYAGSCHNPQTWLLNGSEVVVAVASNVVGFHEDIVFLLIPHQFAIYLGIWMIAIHSLLPSYAPGS